MKVGDLIQYVLDRVYFRHTFDNVVSQNTKRNSPPCSARLKKRSQVSNYVNPPPPLKKQTNKTNKQKQRNNNRKTNKKTTTNIHIRKWKRKSALLIKIAQEISGGLFSKSFTFMTIRIILVSFCMISSKREKSVFTACLLNELSVRLLQVRSSGLL